MSVDRDRRGNGWIARWREQGRQPLYVARQLGHSLPVLFSTYVHLIHEYAEPTQGFLASTASGIRTPPPGF